MQDLIFSTPTHYQDLSAAALVRNNMKYNWTGTLGCKFESYLFTDQLSRYRPGGNLIDPHLLQVRAININGGIAKRLPGFDHDPGGGRMPQKPFVFYPA